MRQTAPAGKERRQGRGERQHRDTIVKKLIQREYIEVKGGKVYSTQLGRDFYGILPRNANPPPLRNGNRSDERGKAETGGTGEFPGFTGGAGPD